MPMILKHVPNKIKMKVASVKRLTMLEKLGMHLHIIGKGESLFTR